ncbi:SMI1/KNR4 family protein [Bacillus marinisedimentorum]|uniref:SMI1/KNR4 family protein n=1 Tax=Bacillus marinisedimentorum TaxID=1821260 RepID=UPI0009F64BC9|nr:SMI1/KNR4 family protein [Bacillus marinisedimentorum]
MFERHDYLFEGFDFNSPIQKNDIEKVEERLGIKFPDDYFHFMLKTNGGEGCIGENSYLRLWKIEELIESNEDYSVEEFAPGLIIVGSNGGGTAYGFDFRNGKPMLVEVDFIGLDIESPFFNTDNFWEFIEYLYKY